jgi:hypothetical protein
MLRDTTSTTEVPFLDVYGSMTTATEYRDLAGTRRTQVPDRAPQAGELDATDAQGGSPSLREFGRFLGQSRIEEHFRSAAVDNAEILAIGRLWAPASMSSGSSNSGFRHQRDLLPCGPKLDGPAHRDLLSCRVIIPERINKHPQLWVSECL